MKTATKHSSADHQSATPQTLTPTAARRTARNGFKLGRTAAMAVLAALFALFAAPTAHALTWDITSGDGSTITDGSGDWNTTPGNLVWNNAGADPNEIWSQNSPAIFGSGTDGTADQWTVTLGEAITAASTTFNNTGYKITANTLTPGVITIATGKTNTIDSTLSFANKTHVINGTLNLSGGNTGGLGGGQIWNGPGTVNIIAGTYTINNQRFNVAAWNQTGGTVNLAGTSSSASWIGYPGAARNANMTVSGGSFNLNGTSQANLGIGRALTAYTATMTVKTGGTVNFGTTGDGNLFINSNGGTTSTSKLDVQGGDLTVGTGATANKIALFQGGAGASKNAIMTQSGGNVTANSIVFGYGSGTWSSSATAQLQLAPGTPVPTPNCSSAAAISTSVTRASRAARTRAPSQPPCSFWAARSVPIRTGPLRWT